MDCRICDLCKEWMSREENYYEINVHHWKPISDTAASGIMDVNDWQLRHICEGCGKKLLPQLGAVFKRLAKKPSKKLWRW